MRLKTVILGFGKMGKIRYRALKAHGSFDVVALCDLDPKNLDGYSERQFADWQDCLNTVDCDVVFVCTYNNSIPDIVCRALEKGCHVFAEKPPGKTLEDAQRMQKVAERTPQCILKFGFNHRFHASVIEAKALLDSGILGSLVCARGVYGKAGSRDFPSQWRSDKTLAGGGILLDQGIHMLDLLYYFMGPFTHIQSEVDNLVWKDIRMEDNAFALLKTQDNKVASFHSSATQWQHKFQLELICSQGYISLDGFNTSTQSYGQETLSYVKKDLLEETGKLGNPAKYVYIFENDNSWALEIDEFHQAICRKRDTWNGNATDAVNIMSFIAQIYR
ncbi:MAG: hypothetical protein A2Y14_04905 [Verrucomicrobia bacterium GWF2_51_19]|nr:MAG: hypothetical protein A2Y14_04905 [Verrucomicrobia bacterium GWF2_51_19]HCJ11950.1 gfo/Idh/MocA family oxidoreductase [Opitutae bacterium]